MENISHALFSQTLQKYPELWGLDGKYICWKIYGKRLADELTKKTNRTITTENVRFKWKRLRMSLNQLNKSKPTGYTTLSAYVWYAQKLGLQNATEQQTEQQTEEQTEGWTDVQTEGQRDAQPFSQKRYKLRNKRRITEEGPSKSAAAEQRRNNRRIEPVVNPEREEAEKGERLVPDIEALREVVGKLTPRDKIVQLHFDEVYSDLT
uniref:MADF domain-containing protein n=1 Tax=Glossina palpalis gambiensis TaxID=67801 RepID=A0A1B0BGN0_9MUSC